MRNRSAEAATGGFTIVMIDSVSNEGAAGAEDLRRTKRKNGAARQHSPTVDRLPPHAEDMEQGVLGCILISPNECMGECLAKLKCGAEAFYNLAHQTIYAALLAMYDARTGIDVMTLMQRLKDGGLLEQVGGIPYLSELPNKVPSAANLTYYLDVVQEKFLLRKMVCVCTDVVGRVYDYEGDVDALMDEVERDILRISESRVQVENRDVKELVRRALAQIEEFHAKQGALTGIGSGFPDFDKMTGGMHPGDMIVIAARPSMGKTSLAMNIAEHVALEQNLPVGVFSLEMTAESLMLRMLCSRARMNLRNVRDGFLAERDFPRMTAAAGKLNRAKLFIDDSSGLSILQLRAKARRMAQQYGIKLFVIDYLQLLHSTNRRAENRQQEIADISGGIKALAKELGVPVVVLSQLNRELEKRERGAKPRMSDLRESGAIEQDADLIGLLYKPNSADEENVEGGTCNSEAVNLLIAKQRNGPTGDVHLTFLKDYTRFENAAKVLADGDEPEVRSRSADA